MLAINGGHRAVVRYRRRETATLAAPERAVTVDVDSLPRSGSWYTLPDGSKAQGREAAADALRRLGYA